MRKNTKRTLGLVVATLATGLIMTTASNAATWGAGTDNNHGSLSLTYGETFNDGLEIGGSEDIFGLDDRTRSNTTYTIVSNTQSTEANRIVTGSHDNHITISKDTMTRQVNKVGDETVTIRVYTPAYSTGNYPFTQWHEATSFDLTVNVSSKFDTDLQGVIDFVDGIDEITVDNVDSIIASEKDYNNLSSFEKAYINKYVSDKSLADDYADLIDKAEAFIDEQAKIFLTENLGVTNFDAIPVVEVSEDNALDVIDAESGFNDLLASIQAKVEEYMDISFEDAVYNAETILATKFVEENDLDVPSSDWDRDQANNAYNIETKFNALPTENIKNKVLTMLNTSNITSVKYAAADRLDVLDAEEFEENYLQDLDDVDMIVLSEQDWNELSSGSKDLVNRSLKNSAGMTYPELLENAKKEIINREALAFINENLTSEDGTVIVEANNDNNKQIIDAEKAYNLLSDEAKAVVNAKLTELGNTTYPDLLEAAQAIQGNPKTGDMIISLIAVALVSLVGVAYTFKSRK